MRIEEINLIAQTKHTVDCSEEEKRKGQNKKNNENEYLKRMNYHTVKPRKAKMMDGSRNTLLICINFDSFFIFVFTASSNNSRQTIVYYVSL